MLKIMFGRIASVALLVFSSLGIQEAHADECLISGPRYQLQSDTVEWLMRIRSGHSCIRGVRFSNVANATIKIISPPRFGQLQLLGPAFSYMAKSNFQGEDFFAVGVSGAIDRLSGTSTIRIVVSIVDASRAPILAVPATRYRPPAPAPAPGLKAPLTATVGVGPPLGSKYPNATNTGVPAGVALTPSGALTLSTPGQVASGLIISGSVSINTSNVTLENCIIEGGGDFVVSVAGGLTGVVIQNCEIVGAGLSGPAGTYGIYVEGDSQVTINADNIHDVGTGVIVSDGQIIVENSYIHDLNAGAGTHYNGISYFGGGGASFSLLIQNNSIINQQTQTDALMIQNYFGAINNVTIRNNLLTGGSYPVYVQGNQNSSPVTNVSITNNDVAANGSAQGGPFDFAGASPTVSGNVLDGTSLAAALPVSPIVSMAAAPSGNYTTGNTLTLTLYMSEAVTVSGTPTVTLNDGGTATYTGGTGTNALTFSYTVANGQNTSALAVTAVNGTIADLDGHALNTSNLPATFAGVAVGTSTGPTISSITESPSSGDLGAGKTVTLTLTMSGNVTVNTAGGTPTLSLNDLTTATYQSSSGNTLTFSYTVAAGQNTAALAATAVTLNGATIKDGAGNAANLSLSGLTQTGPQIDTTAPAAPVIANGTINGNDPVTLTGTAEASSTVKVYDGQTALGTTTANPSGAGSYTTGTLANGTQALVDNTRLPAGTSLQTEPKGEIHRMSKMDKIKFEDWKSRWEKEQILEENRTTIVTPLWGRRSGGCCIPFWLALITDI